MKGLLMLRSYATKKKKEKLDLPGKSFANTGDANVGLGFWHLKNADKSLC